MMNPTQQSEKELDKGFHFKFCHYKFLTDVLLTFFNVFSLKINQEIWYGHSLTADILLYLYQLFKMRLLGI